MTKVAIITGITGQDGSYLSEFLYNKDYIIYGIIRRNSNINTKRINHLYEYESSKLILKYGDLTDHSCIISLLNEIYNKHTDLDVLEIYNLAAMSHVAISYEIPNYTAQVDAIGVLNILEAIKTSPLKEKIRFYRHQQVNCLVIVILYHKMRILFSNLILHIQLPSYTHII